MNKILLNKNNSKKSNNVNNTLNISLGNSKKLLPNDDLYTTISSIEQYNKERLACNDIRLTCLINPISSNVLFNNITEIVKNEGSSGVTWLNYEPAPIKTVYGKNSSFEWDGYEAIRDTQLSNEACGYQYHCGLNIFNNHLLRSKTFKTVCKQVGFNDKFNTIDDFMRDSDGNQVKTYYDIDSSHDKPNIESHLYLHGEILSFKQSVSEKLIEENGWLGFTNVGKMQMYKGEKNDSTLDINKPMNDKKACDFIDMYPERDLFSFNPKYNKFKNRVEKNWNYCLTYPSSATTDISFINQSTKGLNVIYFDENVRDYNGLEVIVFYSVSKHGLNVDDVVNIYKNNEIVIREGKVTNITDDYIFSIYKNGVSLSNEWIELEEKKTEYKSENRDFKLNHAKTALESDNDIFYVVNDRVNVDVTAQNISYKKVVNGIECEYYVRIFSRLPNWRFADKKPTEYEVNKDKKFLEKYQELDNDFESHLTKMGYAKNAYSDDISQVVFSDNIKVDYLKDNLGRPLSEIYFTVIKNNRGYKKWYGKNGDIDIKSEEIEYSHCFGKVNCAFKLSDESLVSDVKYPNVTSLNTIDNKNGLLIDDKLRVKNELNLDDDEIDYYHDLHYYGDLCCYSSIECLEISLQMVKHRFNTAQREVNSKDGSYKFLNELKYDELLFDDYDDKGFTVKNETIKDSNKRKEGYYYQPHYKIQVKTISNNLITQYPKFFTMKDFKELGNFKYEIFTMENNYLQLFDKFVLYDKVENVYYSGIVNELLNLKKFVCTLKKYETNDNVNLAITSFSDFIILKPDVTIPSYAKLADDGTCRYFWREVLQNGFDDETDVEIYPFTNNAIYINLRVDLYLKRQDPNGAVRDYSINGTSMESNVFPYDITPNLLDFDNQDNYYNNLEIKC